MALDIRDVVTLKNGVDMPMLGLGVWRAYDPDALVEAIKSAVSCGYRSIDTGAAYNNEEAVGRGIKACGVRREEIFLTTKLAIEDEVHGYDYMLKCFDVSLKKLDVDYVDMYMLHWPLNDDKMFITAWKAIIEIYNSGRARTIGVCNCNIHHIDEMVEATGFVPMVNQVECHPWLTQKTMREYCAKNSIQFEAFSPLMHGRFGEVPELFSIAEKYGKTAAQVLLRWHLQNGHVIIPKSTHENRIKENCDLYDFELSAADMAVIESCNRDHRLLPDPEKEGSDRHPDFKG